MGDDVDSLMALIGEGLDSELEFSGMYEVTPLMKEQAERAVAIILAHDELIPDERTKERLLDGSLLEENCEILAEFECFWSERERFLKAGSNLINPRIQSFWSSEELKEHWAKLCLKRLENFTMLLPAGCDLHDDEFLKLNLLALCELELMFEQKELEEGNSQKDLYSLKDESSTGYSDLDVVIAHLEVPHVAQAV